MTILYDATFEGYLTAVFDGFYSRCKEVEIFTEEQFGMSLLETSKAETNPEKSHRVYEAICSKLSQYTAEIVYKAWLSHEGDIDTAIYRFLKFAFARGGDVTEMIQNPKVKRVTAAANVVGTQAHKFLGLLRFSKAGEIYVADFEPDYDILPLIAQHFTDRFRILPFVIRDLRHMRMLIHEGGEHPRTALVKMEEAAALENDSDSFEQLWKGYYKSMTIKERINPDYKLRQHFMPQKFWNHICELEDADRAH